MDRPNIIYILADDLGYGDVSCLNEQAAFQTPHLDALQANGLAFTDAHATSAVCTPSRYAILTGRYNWRSVLKKGVLGGFSPPLIDPDRLTVAAMLQQRGYRTAAFGKWHLGMDFATAENVQEQPDFADTEGIAFDRPISNGPTTSGFDTFFGISASLDMPPYAYIQDDRFTQTPTRWTEGTGKGFFRPGRTADDFDHAEVLEVLTQKVLDQIEHWRDDPFFIYFPLTGPHTPILPPKAFQGRSGTNAYGDFVLYCDDIVGRVLSKLKETNLYQDTIVIFTSDNGCAPMADFRELWQYGHNPSYVFRGHKSDIYEGGHRIPLLVQWPARIRAGRTCADLVSLADFMATAAEITGAEIPENRAEDSVSNLPLWLDQPGYPQERSLVQQSVDGSLALRNGDWKLAMCPGSGGWSWPQSGLVIPGAPAFQLFNMRLDIGELKNVIEDEPDITRALKAELARIICSGRSTAGPACTNQGEPVWDNVAWLKDMMGEITEDRRAAQAAQPARDVMSINEIAKEALCKRNLPELWPDAPGSPDETDWEPRRQEIVDILARYVYGRMPGPPAACSAAVLAEDRKAFAGKAIQRTVTLSLDLPKGRFSFPLQYLLPLKRPVQAATAGWNGFPVFVHIAFRPDVPDKYLPAEEIIDEGFALFNFCYQDIAPDLEDHFTYGLPSYFPMWQERPDRWGKIAMWAWAASRVLDFAFQEKDAGTALDLQKAAVVGHSRLGKTALWAGANDKRFRYTISNNSGCAGAALERGKSGETVKAITDRFPYWFCPAYRQFADAAAGMPFDQHFLLAASAPRRVYIASAAEDSWADPEAEFLSACAASSVYQALGLPGLVSGEGLPGDDCLLSEGRVAYHRRPGTHALSRTDWQRFMAYIRRVT